MKNIIITIMMFFALVLSSCKEETIGLQPQDSVPPGPVSDVTYKATPGGVILKYRLPADEDLLYVKAVYSRKEGVFSEAKATIYTDSLIIDGFGDALPTEITLIAVDRSDNESTPVKQMVTPLLPPIFYIGESLNMKPDFGSVNVRWDNPERKDISVVVTVKDNNGEYVPLETFYSSLADGEGYVMDMDTLTVDCAVFAQDRWENKSVVKYATLLPLYESKFDRILFAPLFLPGDESPFPGWGVANMFDGITGNNGFSSIAGNGRWPQMITFDLGITAKISKFRIFLRPENVHFDLGTPTSFDIYTCTELNYSGSWDGWNLLMEDCRFLKPSGLPYPQYTAEDRTASQEGQFFFNRNTEVPVRYIRLKVYGQIGGGDNFQLSEIEVYGQQQ